LFKNPEDPIFEEVSSTIHVLSGFINEPPQDVNYDFIYDQIAPFGELISTKILHTYFNQNKLKCQWLDARKYIKTNKSYREAKIDWDVTSSNIKSDIPKLLEDQHIITQGFIGSTNNDHSTTLGREGSDFTASIFASVLNAKSVTIWKDVEGVLNADPKEFEDTVKYKDLPYSETIEMAYYGASVIHPKTIKPLQNNNIPLYVKPFDSPKSSGTIISNAEKAHYKIPATIIKKNQILISISPKDLSFIAEDHLSEIFSYLAEFRIKINLMQNSAISFSLCVDNRESKIKPFIEKLISDYHILRNEDAQLVTIRHYTDEVIESLTKDKEILLEQRSRGTAQFILK
ncbi:MAG: aspartate kinase, partial [Bacteroidia bacterium]|nr:aspartate kinase [Bacteroidia bacterium]